MNPAPARGSGPSPLEDVLAAYLRETGLGASLRSAHVFEAWSAVLGSEFRSRARPVRFESGELWVEVESAVHLHELRNFAGEAYRRSANERLASRRASAIIERIVFKLKR